METLASLESFVRSAESGSFSAAARRLGMTPAGVSKNVAGLEARLGVRLFQRSTRKLTLTEAGERFLADVRGGIDNIEAAIAAIVAHGGEPSGTLRVSLPYAFGLDHVLPMLKGFCRRYPGIVPDWHFANRRVDLISEGYDAAIGGGFELSPGVVAKELARARMIVVASPQYMRNRKIPKHPADLAAMDGVVRRSARTGRIVTVALKHVKTGEEFIPEPRPRVVFDDAQAIANGAALGLGVGISVVPHALRLLTAGKLTRLLPQWEADIGPISIYFAGGRRIAPKTRAFVDFAVEYFRDLQLDKRLPAG
jgi:DNA-binding transcriptional LysR family regulator